MQANIRCADFFLAETARRCQRCHGCTRVVAILLPAGHEVLREDDDPTQDHWERSDEPTLLSYVNYLPERAGRAVRQLAPRYRLDDSRTLGYAYWMNHCEHCDAKLGDSRLHEHLGAGFDPATPAQAARIVLRSVSAVFEAGCGNYTCGVEFMDAMRRR